LVGSAHGWQRAGYAFILALIHLGDGAGERSDSACATTTKSASKVARWLHIRRRTLDRKLDALDRGANVKK
jgi:ActR/RegA family two-component response regulator